MITNAGSQTAIDEIAPAIYRIRTPVTTVAGGFSFNQYLVIDDEPLLFHTGPRGIFPLVSEAIAAVTPIESVRYLAFSHYENDECGAMNLLLAAAPEAVPVCGRIGGLVNAGAFDRPVRALNDGESLSLGARVVRWLDAPHLPHAWDCGYLVEPRTRTLFCGDLFTQPGPGDEPLTRADILGPSEKLRASLEYYAHARNTRALIERLAKESPATLACMHGSAWSGDGAALLHALADRLAP